MGWEIAKRLLQYERQNISGGFASGGGGAGGAAGDIAEIAKRYIGVDETGALADPDLRGRITQNKIDLKAFYLTLSRVAAESKASNGPSAATSIIKYAAATLAQQRSELMVEAMGHQALGWEGEAFTPFEKTVTRGWLRSKGNSIEGGTSEVNVNVVSKRGAGAAGPGSKASGYQDWRGTLNPDDRGALGHACPSMIEMVAMRAILPAWDRRRASTRNRGVWSLRKRNEIDAPEITHLWPPPSQQCPGVRARAASDSPYPRPIPLAREKSIPTLRPEQGRRPRHWTRRPSHFGIR